MSRRTSIVEAYFDGFRSSDHEQILSLLTEDVVWTIHGHRRVEGRQEFDGEIENDAFEGSPELTVERLIDGGVVVAPHTGKGRIKGGAEFRFAGCTVFRFEADLIAEVDSYIVPLT